MLQIDFPSLLMQIFNFLVLLFVLNFILYRPVRSILKKRREDMASSQEMTENFLRKAQKYSQEYDFFLESTRREGISEKEDLKNEGLTLEKDMLQETYSSVEEKLANARKEIILTVEEARKSLQEEVEIFSKELVKKVLGRSIG